MLPCCKIIRGTGFLIGFSGKVNLTGTVEVPYFFSESYNFIVSLKPEEETIKRNKIKDINLLQYL